MPEYDTEHFHPPAPVALVTLQNVQSRAAVSDVKLLLDSGADITLLPRAQVEQLGIPLDASLHYELVGFDGSRSFAPVADLEMIFLRKAFRGRYLLTDAAHGILGRDVLNHLPILLDGPRRQWQEYREPNDG